MLRTLLLAALGLLTLQNVYAQTGAKSDTLKYYFDADNIETSKDSADHSLMILPKSEKDGGLYPVLEYYKNGKIKLSAFLTTQSFTSNFEGLSTTYYPNGNKQRIANYHNGLIVDGTTEFFENGNKRRASIYRKTKTGQEESKITEYFPSGSVSKILDFNVEYKKGLSTRFFPNGKIYLTRELNSGFEGDYINCYDSTGFALANKGNGKLIVYSDNFTIAIKQAPVKDGISGKWEPIVDSAAIVHYDQTGPIEKVPAVMPFFDETKKLSSYGTRLDFEHFFLRNFDYPKHRTNKNSGEVNLTMVVEKDGALTHIKTKQTVSKEYADEVSRVVELSAPWTPGTLLDGTIARVPVSIQVIFDFRPTSYPNIGVLVDNNSKAIDSAYNKTDSVFLSGNIDKQPEFPGGLAGIVKFIGEHIRYPLQDREIGLTGKVYVQFVIEKNGHVSNVHALSGPSITLKSAAARVVSSFSNWQPGSIDNKPVRVLYTLPVNFALNTESTYPFGKPSVMPQFPGGLDAFSDFLRKNVRFPKSESSGGITGTVYTQFIIEKDGSLSNIKVVRSPGQPFSDEARRVLRMSPKWKPGTDAEGKPIKVLYTIPIKFGS